MTLLFCIAIMVFILCFSVIAAVTSYKFAQLELKKDHLAFSREILDHTLASDDNDDEMARIFRRTATDPTR